MANPDIFIGGPQYSARGNLTCFSVSHVNSFVGGGGEIYRPITKLDGVMAGFALCIHHCRRRRWRSGVTYSVVLMSYATGPLYTTRNPKAGSTDAV